MNRPFLGVLVFSLQGCGGGGEAPCLQHSDPVARENCYFERLSALYPTDPDGFQVELAALDSAASRDLVRLRLAIDDPSRASALCREVETEGAQEKCRQVLGRPHLRSRQGPPQPPPLDDNPLQASEAPGAASAEGASP